MNKSAKSPSNRHGATHWGHTEPAAVSAPRSKPSHHALTTELCSGLNGSSKPSVAFEGASSLAGGPAPASAPAIAEPKRVTVNVALKQKQHAEQNEPLDMLERNEMEQRKRIARLNGIKLECLRNADGAPLNAEYVLTVISAGLDVETGRSGKMSTAASSMAGKSYSSPCLVEKVSTAGGNKCTASPTGKCHPVRSRRVELRSFDPHASIDHLVPTHTRGAKEAVPLSKAQGFLTSQAYVEKLRCYEDEALDGVGFYDGNTMNASTKLSVDHIEHDVRLRMGIAQARVAWRQKELQTSWIAEMHCSARSARLQFGPATLAVHERGSGVNASLFSRSPRVSVFGRRMYGGRMMSSRSQPSHFEVVGGLNCFGRGVHDASSRDGSIVNSARLLYLSHEAGPNESDCGCTLTTACGVDVKARSKAAIRPKQAWQPTESLVLGAAAHAEAANEEGPDSPIAFESFLELKSMYTSREQERHFPRATHPPPSRQHQKLTGEAANRATGGAPPRRSRRCPDDGSLKQQRLPRGARARAARQQLGRAQVQDPIPAPLAAGPPRPVEPAWRRAQDRAAV